MSERKYVVLHANYGKWGIKNGTFRKFFVGNGSEYNVAWTDKPERASLFDIVQANYIARRLKKSKGCHHSDTVLVIPYDNLNVGLTIVHDGLGLTTAHDVSITIDQDGSDISTDWVCRSIEPSEEGLYWVDSLVDGVVPAYYKHGRFQNMAGTNEGRRCWRGVFEVRRYIHIPKPEVFKNG